MRSGPIKDETGRWDLKPECGEVSHQETWDCALCYGEAIPLALLRSLSNLLNSDLLHRRINGPCRGHPLGDVHPMEFDSIVTGEPSPLGECGTWDTEREVRGRTCGLPSSRCPPLVTTSHLHSLAQPQGPLANSVCTLHLLHCFQIPRTLHLPKNYPKKLVPHTPA